jgi:hypothetical protein
LGHHGKVDEIFLRITDGLIYQNATAVLAMPSGMLMKSADGGFALGGPDVQRRTIVPANCRGHLLHVDVPRRALVVSCERKQGARERSLWVFSAESASQLGSTYDTNGDDFSVASDRFVRVNEAWLDLATRTIVKAPPLDAPHEIQLVREWHLYEQGIYAERGDGRQLRVERPGAKSWHAPMGPLRWRPPRTPQR